MYIQQDMNSILIHKKYSTAKMFLCYRITFLWNPGFLYSLKANQISEFSSGMDSIIMWTISQVWVFSRDRLSHMQELIANPQNNFKQAENMTKKN